MVARNRRKKQASSINPARRRTRQGTIPFVKEITAADLTESTLSSNAIRLYLWLRSRAGFKSGKTWVGYQSMADANHWSYSTARRAYGELVEANLILPSEQEDGKRRMTAVVMEREAIRARLIARGLLGDESGGVLTGEHPTSSDPDTVFTSGPPVLTGEHGGGFTDEHLSESTRSESTKSESTFADPLRGPAEGRNDDTVRRDSSQGTEVLPGKISEDERSEDERNRPPRSFPQIVSDPGPVSDERSEERKQPAAEKALDDLEKQRTEKAPGASRKRVKQRAPAQAAFRPSGGLSPGEGVEATTRSTPPPETPEEVVALLKAEIVAAGLPNSSGLPEGRNHAWETQAKKLLGSGFSTTQIRDMIRVLVWDWMVAREQVAKWTGDPILHESYPDMNAVWRYRDRAASKIETGFTATGDQKRGVPSRYHARYRKPTEPRRRGENPFTALGWG